MRTDRDGWKKRLATARRQACKVVAVAVGLFLTAPAATAQPPLWHYKASFSFSATNFCDTVPITWERNQVYVPVTIMGKTYRFLLDTGAGQTVVFAGTTLAMGEPVGVLRSHDAVGHVETVSVVRMPPMQIGQVTLFGGKATVQQRSVVQQSIDGILGFDLVNGGLALKIDVNNQRLIISDRTDVFRNEEGGIRMKYRLNYHVPFVDIIPFGRQRQRMLFDTGSRQFFTMNVREFQDAVDDDDLPDGLTIEGRSLGQHAIGANGVEGTGEVVFLRLDNLRLGDYAFSDIHALTTQGGSHIGAALLRHGAVAFCPRKRELIFTPVNRQQPCAVGNRQLEIAFVAAADNRPQVGLVWEGGIPYRQGLRQGDIIEQIDGRPVRDISQFIRWPFIPGRAYTFTLLSPDGQRRTVQWIRLPKRDE